MRPQLNKKRHAVHDDQVFLETVPHQESVSKIVTGLKMGENPNLLLNCKSRSTTLSIATNARVIQNLRIFEDKFVIGTVTPVLIQLIEAKEILPTLLID